MHVRIFSAASVVVTSFRYGDFDVNKTRQTTKKLPLK